MKTAFASGDVNIYSLSTNLCNIPCLSYIDRITEYMFKATTQTYSILLKSPLMCRRNLSTIGKVYHPLILRFCHRWVVKKAASLAQSFKALFPITQVGSLNPYRWIVFEHICKAGDKTADSAWFRLVYADAEEIMRSATTYRATVDAT